MHIVLALLGILAFLLIAFLLSYPVGWLIDHTVVPVLNYLQRKRVEWDTSFRD